MQTVLQPGVILVWSQCLPLCAFLSSLCFYFLLLGPKQKCICLIQSGPVKVFSATIAIYVCLYQFYF